MEQYGRRLYLRIKKIRKQENESPNKVLEQLSAGLVRQVLISQMRALIVRIVLVELMTR